MNDNIIKLPICESLFDNSGSVTRIATVKSFNKMLSDSYVVLKINSVKNIHEAHELLNSNFDVRFFMRSDKYSRVA